MRDRVELNGELVSASDAMVSVFDVGLLYGAGLFETMRVVRGVAIDLERHLQRLQRSADSLGWTVPTHELLEERVARWCRASELALGHVRLTVTLGSIAGRSKLDPADPVTIVFGGPLPDSLTESKVSGITAITVTLQPGGSAGHKSLAYWPWWRAKIEATRAGVGEAILISPGEHVIEGAMSNVFVRHSGQWLAPMSGAALPGVTRSRVIEQLSRSGESVDESELHREALSTAQEIFVTQSTAGVLPVVSIDGRAIGDGRPGPATRAASEAYEHWVEEWRRAGDRG
ncbi:MAG: aminotransferase class IV [Planctomycetota bacterium]